MACKGSKRAAGEGGAPAQAKRAKKGGEAGEKITEAYNPAIFTSEVYHQHFVTKFSERKILVGRTVDIEELEKNNLHVRAILEKVGLLTVCTVREVCYPRLVRLFYTHLGQTNTGTSILSIVKGVPIELNAQRICEILNLPMDDDQAICKMSMKDLWASISGKAVPEDKNKWTAKDLNAIQRVLHLVAGQIVLPKSGSHDQVNFEEMLIIHSILKEEKLNLGVLILKEITETHRKIMAQKGEKTRDQNLPYGMILTLVFEHFKVSLNGEDSQQLDRHSIISTTSLKRSQFTLHKGEWIRLEEVAAAEERDQEPVPSTAAPNAEAEPMITTVPTENTQEPAAAAVQSLQTAPELQDSQLEGLEGIKVPSPNLLDDTDRDILEMVSEINKGTKSRTETESSHREPVLSTTLGLYTLKMTEALSIRSGVTPPPPAVAPQGDSFGGKLDKVLEGIQNISARVEKLEGKTAQVEGEPSKTHELLDNIMHKLENLSSRVAALEAKESINPDQVAIAVLQKLEPHFEATLEGWVRSKIYPNMEHLNTKMKNHVREHEDKMNELLQKNDRLKDMYGDMNENMLKIRSWTLAAFNEVRRNIHSEGPLNTGPTEPENPAPTPVQEQTVREELTSEVAPASEKPQVEGVAAEARMKSASKVYASTKRRMAVMKGKKAVATEPITFQEEVDDIRTSEEGQRVLQSWEKENETREANQQPPISLKKYLKWLETLSKIVESILQAQRVLAGTSFDQPAEAPSSHPEPLQPEATSTSSEQSAGGGSSA